TASLGQGGVQPPLTQPDDIEGYGREQMLQMRLGEPEIPSPAQTTASDTLRVRALDPGPLGVLGFERGRLLPLPRGLDRVVDGLRPDRELSGGVFCPGARAAGWTDTTGRCIKADAHDGVAGDIPPRGPFHTRMALGTTRLFRLPLDHEGA